LTCCCCGARWRCGCGELLLGQLLLYPQLLLSQLLL
jgi:hypothetical protein